MWCVVCGVWRMVLRTTLCINILLSPYARCRGWGRSGREMAGNMKLEHVWSDIFITKEPGHRDAGLHITTC